MHGVYVKNLKGLGLGTGFLELRHGEAVDAHLELMIHAHAVYAVGLRGHPALRAVCTTVLFTNIRSCRRARASSSALVDIPLRRPVSSPRHAPFSPLHPASSVANPALEQPRAVPRDHEIEHA